MSFLFNPLDHKFTPEDSPFFEDNNSYLAIGIQKGVCLIEGPRGNRNTALYIQTKKTPFHAVENVLEKASCFVQDINRCEFGDFERLSRQLKGNTFFWLCWIFFLRAKSRNCIW